MAEAHSTAARSLLDALRVDALWHGDYYEGTRAELIAAGLAKEGMFPGDPGRNKVQQTYRKPTKVCISMGRKGRFSVYVPVDAEEQQQRKEREECRRDLARATQEQERELESLPTSAEDFRRRALQFTENVCGALHDVMRSIGHGYRFDRDTMQTVEWALAEATRAMENGHVVFDATARKRRIVEIQRRVAAADPVFQSFLASTR